MEKAKKSFFENPLLSTKIKSAKAKLFPEGVLGYFIGPTLALIANSVLSGYFNMYMSNVLDITSWLGKFGSAFFTWLPVISVIMVVAGNILVGRLMDHLKTRAGKARPLILLSIPLAVLALLILFVFSPLPKNDTERIVSLVLIAIGYNMWFAIAYPVYYTSHAALVNLSTRNSKDRSLLATISNATALAAMGLCTMILPFFLGLLFVYQMDPAIVSQTEGALAVFNADYVKALGGLFDGTYKITLADGTKIAVEANPELYALFDPEKFTIPVALLATVAGFKTGFGGTLEVGKEAGKFDLYSGALSYYTNSEGGALYDQDASYKHWKIFVIALMVAVALGALVEYYFTRERITEESLNSGTIETKKKATPIGQQAKVCFKDKFWIIIIAFFFLYQLGGMIKNVSQLYYCQAMFPNDNGIYTTESGGFWSGQLAIYGAIPTALGMVIAWPLANKIGKGRAILFGAILAVIGGVIGFIPSFISMGTTASFAVVVTSFIIKALGSTPAMYLSLALLADILDHQEAKHGFRTDGLTMTIYGAIMAGMTGIATGIMNGVLSAVGYSTTNVSSPAIRTAMTWIFIGGETMCYVGILVIFIFMGVEKYIKEDHEAIKERQKAEALARGEEWIEPEERMRREEEESNRLAEEARIAQLKAKCEKKGLNFEEEEAKYQAKVEAKRQAAEAKKQAAEAKKKAAEEKKLSKQKAEKQPQEQETEQVQEEVQEEDKKDE